MMFLLLLLLLTGCATTNPAFQSRVPYSVQKADGDFCDDSVACTRFTEKGWILFYRGTPPPRSIRHEIEFHIECNGKHGDWIYLPPAGHRAYAEIISVSSDPRCAKYPIGAYLYVDDDATPTDTVLTGAPK